MAGLSDVHARWLESRQIDIEKAVQHGVESRDAFLAFRYLEGSETRYAKLRTIDKSRWRTDPTGVEATRLWNEDCLSEEPGQHPLIICEGELDALSVLQAGYQFVVSVPTGAPDRLPDGGEMPTPRYLIGSDDKLKPDVAKFAHVVLLTDGDRAGANLRRILANVIGAGYCSVPAYPDACKDANDVLMKHDVAGVRALVDEAQPLKSDGFTPLTDIDGRQPRTYSTAMPFLDPHLQLIRPEFFVIGGAAGAGKSSVAQAIVFGLCWQHGWRASLFAGEGAPSVVLTRAKSFWRGVSNADTREPEVQHERDAWIRDHLAFIKPPQDELPTFEWFMWAIEQQALRRRRDVFLLDPWNQVIKQRPVGISVTDWTGEAIMRLMNLGKRHNLVLIVVHHIKKPEDPRRLPSPYDLADSAHWYNASDHCLIVHRPDESKNRTQLWVAKSKDHGFMGVPGKVWANLQSSPFRLLQIVEADGEAT